MANNKNAIANLKPCKKGETHNPNGRPKNVFKHLKNLYELSADDLSTLITYMMSLPVNDLKAIIQNPATPVLQSSIASAIIGSLKKGNLDAVNILLDRRFGKATQTQKTEANLTLTTPPNISVSFTQPVINDTTNKPTDSSDISSST